MKKQLAKRKGIGKWSKGAADLGPGNLGRFRRRSFGARRDKAPASGAQPAGIRSDGSWETGRRVSAAWMSAGNRKRSSAGVADFSPQRRLVMTVPLVSLESLGGRPSRSMQGQQSDPPSCGDPCEGKKNQSMVVIEGTPAGERTKPFFQRKRSMKPAKDGNIVFAACLTAVHHRCFATSYSGRIGDSWRLWGRRPRRSCLRVRDAAQNPRSEGGGASRQVMTIAFPLWGCRNGFTLASSD